MLSSLLIVGLFILVIKVWVHRIFKRDLEHYRSVLIKKILQHKVLSEKKFEKYSHMFELLILAYGLGREIYSAFHTPSDWASYKKEDLEDFLERENATKEEIKEILSLYKTDKKIMAEKLKVFNLKSILHKAKSKLLTARDHLIIMGLWLEDDIEKKIEHFLDKLYSVFEHIETYITSGEQKHFKKGMNAHKHLEKELHVLKLEIRNILKE